MTGFFWISVLLALATPLVTRGSYRTMLETRWRWGLLFAGAVALSIVSEHLPTPGGHDLGFGALVASYALLLAFCGRNLVRTGIAVVMIGIAANAIAITVNHGMPVKLPHAWAVDGGMRTTVKHHATDASTHLYWMTDVIYLPATNEVLSFGDLVISIGLIDMAFRASRRRRAELDASSAHAHGTEPAVDADALATDTAAAPVVTIDPARGTVRVMPRDDIPAETTGETPVEPSAGSGREPAEHPLERVDGGTRTSVGVRSS